MSVKYTFSINNDFPNSSVTTSSLAVEIGESTIVVALDYINTISDDCNIWFKDNLTSTDETTLSGVVSAHTAPIPDEAPTMDDGRPIVRADTRPLDTQTYFTMVGDTSSGIGDGKVMKWDFSNSDDLYDPLSLENGLEIPLGYKAKRIDMVFTDVVYMKDGTMYFFDSPWGCYCSMCIVVPAGNYYPNNAGTIPASALGLSGSQMYAYASKDVAYTCYVRNHMMCGSCPMGDELNAEGAAVNGVPIGWYITGIIVTPNSDNVSKGYGSFEMYRHKTMLLPGETI